MIDQPAPDRPPADAEGRGASRDDPGDLEILVADAERQRHLEDEVAGPEEGEHVRERPIILDPAGDGHPRERRRLGQAVEVAIHPADRPAVEVVVGVADPLDRVLEVLQLVLGHDRQRRPGQPLEGGDRVVRAVAEVAPADRVDEAVEVRADALLVLGVAVVADLERPERAVAEAGGHGQARGFEGRPRGGRLAEPAAGGVLVAEVARGDAVEPVARDQLVVQGEQQFLLGGEPVFDVVAVLAAATLPAVVGRHADLSGGGVHPASCPLASGPASSRRADPCRFVAGLRGRAGGPAARPAGGPGGTPTRSRFARSEGPT